MNKASISAFKTILDDPMKQEQFAAQLQQIVRIQLEVTKRKIYLHHIRNKTCDEYGLSNIEFDMFIQQRQQSLRTPTN